jgi:hypothetical protein
MRSGGLCALLAVSLAGVAGAPGGHTASAATVASPPTDGPPPVRLSAGSPFARTCVPRAVRGFDVEPTAAFVPGAQTLLAAWQADRARFGADAIVAATSADGGLTWTPPRAVAGLSRCSGGSAPAVSDPWLAVGPDGTAYLAAITVTTMRAGRQAFSLLVARSLDGGRSWQPPVTVAPDQRRAADKPTITADPSRPGVAYLTWTVNDRARSGRYTPRRDIVTSRTLDAGVSWSPPAVVARPARNASDLFPEVEVGPSGMAALVYTSSTLRGLLTVRFRHELRTSNDAGATWSTPVALDRFKSVFAPVSLRPFALVRADPRVFALAAGPGGAFLVTATIDSLRTSRIVVSQQLTDGAWTAPRTIAQVHALVFLPAVALSGPRQVAVTWYQMQASNRRRRLAVTVQSAVSADAGGSWRQQPLGPSFDPSAATLDRRLFFGDYEALTAAPGGFEAVYVRTPAPANGDRTEVVAQAIAP